MDALNCGERKIIREGSLGAVSWFRVWLLNQAVMDFWEGGGGSMRLVFFFFFGVGGEFSGVGLGDVVDGLF